MSDEENRKILLGKIITRAWHDEGFKQRLLENAAAALREEGFEVPEGLTVRAVENTERLVHIIIPDRPPVGEAFPIRGEAGCNCWQGEYWN